MDRIRTFTSNAKLQQTNTDEALLKSGSQSSLSRSSSFSKGTSTSFSSNENGFDLTTIPVRPALQSGQQVQCCAKDGAGCSCPKCQAAAEATKARDGLADISATEETVPEQSTAEQTEEMSPTTELTETEESETANELQQTIAGLIVDDSVAELSDGQMWKTAFLQNLRSAICNTIGPVLATVGQTTDGCPYLNYWLDLYQEKDAAHIEKTARKYAPDVAAATTAEAYITIISQRALRAAEIWARTGRLSGIPDGVPATLPGESPAPVQAKAKNGGVKRADDPQAIKQQLGEGQPLSPGVRSRMETAFGTSFSNVRTHTDSTASGLSGQVNARAFTVGNHIAFGSGEYQPETPLGDALIAHELAHTIQQKGTKNSVDKMETGDDRYNQLEADADKTATGVITALWGNRTGARENLPGSISKLRSGLSLQRCSKDPPAPKAVKNITVDMVKMRGSTRNPASDLTTASTVFAGCNVSFTSGQNVTVPNADSDAWLGGDTDIQVSSNCGSVSAEEKKSFDEAKSKYGLSSRMKFLYVDTLSGINALGYSIPPYCATSAAAPYVDHGVIPNNALPDTLAHELGHILINSGQHSGIDNPADKTNLMFAPGRTGSNLDNSQCNTIYANA
ncbi:MAG: DUF4157 domain-containing protein [Chitinophagaceae bacterium]|nr:DUF4157 domain-containing protein [Chitinophagaceae bacterium]MCW5926538.1 DUF4157 domain-containing protein [Chitinophagaceae bacterium]